MNKIIQKRKTHSQKRMKMNRLSNKTGRIILIFIMNWLYVATGVGQIPDGVLISNTPDSVAAPSAVLEVQSKDKGVLIPRIEENVKNDNAVIETTDGLLVFQKDGEKGFWYYDEHYGDWLRIWEEGDGTEGFIMPKGGIIMYHGSDSLFDDKGVGKKGTEMEGWALCNGKGNRPDLRGKFIVGGGDSERKEEMHPLIREKISQYTSILNEGGNNDNLVSLDETYLPTHKHPFTPSYPTELSHHHDLKFGRHGYEFILNNNVSGNLVQMLNHMDNLFSIIPTFKEGAGHQHSLDVKKGTRKSKRLVAKEKGMRNEENIKKYNSTNANYGINYSDYEEAKIEVNMTDEDENTIINKVGNSNVEVDIRPKYYVIAFIIRTDNKPNEKYDENHNIDYFKE